MTIASSMDGRTGPERVCQRPDNPSVLSPFVGRPMVTVVSADAVQLPMRKTAAQPSIVVAPALLPARRSVTVFRPLSPPRPPPLTLVRSVANNRDTAATATRLDSMQHSSKKQSDRHRKRRSRNSVQLYTIKETIGGMG